MQYLQAFWVSAGVPKMHTACQERGESHDAFVARFIRELDEKQEECPQD